MSAEICIKRLGEDVFVEYEWTDYGIGPYSVGDGHYFDSQPGIEIISAVDQDGEPVEIDDWLAEALSKALEIEI